MSERKTSTMRNMLEEHIRGFVRKSGGRKKVIEARDAIQREARDGECHLFLARMAESKVGAKQLCAAALLGLIVASIVAESDARRAEAN